MPYKDIKQQNKYKHEWYMRNRELTNQRTKINRKIKKPSRVEHIRKEKNKPCMDCGVKYPYYVMDFDHRPDTEKKNVIGRMASNSSIKKIVEEIEKCDLVCANCHRERTFKRMGKT